MSRLSMPDQCLLLQVRGDRRDKPSILSAMLSQSVKGLGKTEIMYKVGLSSQQMDKYLHVLVRANMLEILNHSKKATYLTTDKGRRFLVIFYMLLQFLD